MNLGENAEYLHRGVRGFLQPLQASSGIVPLLGHLRFFSNLFQLTRHPTIRRHTITEILAVA
jgi:hypothetical protein